MYSKLGLCVFVCLFVWVFDGVGCNKGRILFVCLFVCLFVFRLSGRSLVSRMRWFYLLTL